MEQRNPRVQRMNIRETGEYESLIYRVNFWRPMGPDPDTMWYCDDFYLQDLNVAAVMNWGTENLEQGEILEVQALAQVTDDEIVAYTLYGERPTKNRNRAADDGAPTEEPSLLSRSAVDSSLAG